MISRSVCELATVVALSCVVTSVFVALSCVVTSVLAEEVLMTPDEIQKAWVDKKVFTRAQTGGLFDFYLKSDNSAELSGTGWSDTGTWRMSENGYCAKWKKIRGGEERCFTVVKNGSTVTVLNPDKSVSGEILKVGN
jgi:hypothetical protein